MYYATRAFVAHFDNEVFPGDFNEAQSLERDGKVSIRPLTSSTTPTTPPRGDGNAELMSERKQIKTLTGLLLCSAPSHVLLL
jgi:hypothetical protein